MLELHPEDLKKQWLHCRVGSRNSNKGGSLRPSSSNCLFVSFSIPSLLPFSILSLLPFLISPSLSTIPSCFLINCLSEDKHFMFHSVSLLSQAPLARGSCALSSVLLCSVTPIKWQILLCRVTFIKITTTLHICQC